MTWRRSSPSAFATDMTHTDAGLLGGIATLNTHGVERCPCCGRAVPSRYYSDIGTKGGVTTIARYGRAHMTAIGKRGGRPRRQAADAAVDKTGAGASPPARPRR